MHPKRGNEGAIGYDLSIVYDYIIPFGDKGIVQRGLTFNLPLGTYAKVAPCSRHAMTRFIDMGAGVVNGNY